MVDKSGFLVYIPETLIHLLRAGHALPLLHLYAKIVFFSVVHYPSRHLTIDDTTEKAVQPEPPSPPGRFVSCLSCSFPFAATAGATTLPVDPLVS